MRRSLLPVSCATQQQPRFSISQVSTLAASFTDDLHAYAAAGVDGIGIWELKLGDSSLAEFRASGLGSATAVPSFPSVHPLPLLSGPDAVRERIDALHRSLEVLAPFEPAAILCFTGPGDRATAVRGVREIAREAERLERVVVELDLPEADPVDAGLGVRAYVVSEARGERAHLRDREPRRVRRAL